LKIPLTNSFLTKSNKKYDLIHCAHCFSKNKNRPWIADFEGGVWQFYLGNETNFLKKKIKKMVLRKECKKILPWTLKVKNLIEKEFPEIKEKIEVVYPAFPIPSIKRKKHKGINLLYAARYFYGKGGLHTLEAIDRLTKKHKNVYGTFISADIPEEIRNKYSKNPKIKFYDIIPQKKLFEEILPTSDVFIYPGYKDSFGFAMVEVMSFGIPIITVNGFARKEIVEDGKQGFVIDVKKDVLKPEMRKHNEKIVSEIVIKAELLIKNKKLREKMSKNCIEIIKNGKFSIKERNKKLGKIYEEALK
jgi:glycosyltransferase involved in cell wall biosynthesis